MSYSEKKQEKTFKEFMEDSLSKNKDITDIIDIRKNIETLPQNFTPTEDWFKMRERLDNLMGQIRMHDLAVKKYGLESYKKNLQEMIPQAKELATKLQAPIKTSAKPKGGGGKLGLLLSAGLLGAGSLIPKDSRAGSTIEKVAEAADKADPSYWFNEGIVQGREEVDKLIEKIKHERILKELQDRAEQEDKIRKEKEALLKQDITPVVELLSGKPAIKPKEAEVMTGEVPAGEENIISVEDSDRKMRNKLGYR